MITQNPANAKRIVPLMIYLIFFAVLNETVFNVSTPMIARQFSLSAAGVSWMMTIFMVFFGIGSVIYGRLSDIYSLRGLIIAGIVVYDAGSIMGFALQSSYPLVVTGRALQGIGGSAIPALVFVVAARYIPEAERGRVFGFITSTVSLAIGLGPVIGGLVSSRLHWSWLFLIPLLLLAAIPLLGRELPREPRRQGRLDLVGALLVALVVGCLVVYLNISRWYFLAGLVVLAVLFVLQARGAAEPFIRLSLFRNLRFRNGVIAGFCLFFCVIGVLFLIPLMLNEVHGLSTSSIGLILFPGAISSVVFGPVAGTLADRKGNAFVVALGLVLLVASLLLMAFLLGRSPVYVAGALLLTYIGFALLQTAMVNGVSQTLAPDETGVGMGVFNLVGVMSGAVGTAVVGRILSSGWLSSPLLPVHAMVKGLAYSNLMAGFAVVLVLSGVLYLGSGRGAQAERSAKRSASEA
jgi:DHA2 family metal-tetracycline-proton antiporter-like MFS transporter